MIRCWLCPAAYRYIHHLTGRIAGTDSRYLDPELTRPVCHDDHELVADDWHTIGSPEKAEPLSNPFDRVQARLRRSGAFFGRKSEADPGDGFWGQLARSHSSWADDLAEGMAHLDERYPGWREGFPVG